MKRFLSIPAVLVSTIWAADLPVRDVILYKNGIAYFERSGDLKAGEAARLEFKASEMNDVLKSLTVFDGGGKITAVRYDSSDPLERRLAEFPVRPASSQPLSAFLDQMRGSAVSFKYGSEAVSGVIASARALAGDREHGEREQVTILLDSGDLRSFDLSATGAIHFADPAVARQLQGYLGIVNQARSTDRRNVYIDSTGAAARRIAASYMIPAPVWKSSYRLIFGAAAEPVLEGWAIVDNTTGEDWTGIRLALVSGRPISFISRLYEPRYRQRPFAELAEDQAVAPVVYEAQVGGQPAAAPLAAQYRASAGKAMPRMSDAMAATGSTAAVNTAGREVGELFEYRFSTPVTVKRGESAMLPFLQEKVAARKLLIYSDENSQNPMNATEVTNSTGKTLDGGPITVYDAGAYGGEALVETLKSGDKRLIGYAVDLGTRVTTAIDSARDFVREMHFNRGVLTTKSAVQETKTYTIRNVDQKAKTLMIEHPLRPGYKLLNQKPAEITAHAYRFEVKLPAAAAEKFTVNEERVYENTTLLRSQTPDVLLTYIQNRSLSDGGRHALQLILDQKRAIAAADAESSRLQAEMNDLERDQNRLRQNIASLNRVSGQEQQVQQYARQLAAAESSMAALRDKLNEQRRKKQTLDAALNEMLDKTVF